jgi:hypothetical protein
MQYLMIWRREECPGIREKLMQFGMGAMLAQFESEEEPAVVSRMGMDDDSVTCSNARRHAAQTCASASTFAAAYLLIYTWYRRGSNTDRVSRQQHMIWRWVVCQSGVDSGFYPWFTGQHQMQE